MMTLEFSNPVLAESSRFWDKTAAKYRITLEPGKRGGKPCIRGLRIAVYDILSLLASGMQQSEILEDFPELEVADILAALAYAADREHRVAVPNETTQFC